MAFADVDEADEVEVDQPSPAKKERGPGGDRQTLLLRRIGAVVIGIIILVLAVVGVRGCLGARKDRSIKGYVGNVTDLTKESDAISRDFFDVLENPGDLSEQELQTRINSFRASADELVKRAQQTGHPGDLDSANGWLVDSLEFRRDGLAVIAENLSAALGDTNRKAASDRIAGQMQAFLTSDVIYSQRVVPDITKVLDKRNLSNQVSVPKSIFLPDLTWLQPDTVAERLALVKGGGQIAPGVHGMEIVQVLAKPGDTILTNGGDTTLKPNPRLEFDIQVVNGSDVNEESDVAVAIKLTGSAKLNVEKTISRIKPGETVTIRVPLTAAPKPGSAQLNVSISPVLGEEVTDNNKGTYNLNFG